MCICYCLESNVMQRSETPGSRGTTPLALLSPLYIHTSRYHMFTVAHLHMPTKPVHPPFPPQFPTPTPCPSQPPPVCCPTVCRCCSFRVPRLQCAESIRTPSQPHAYTRGLPAHVALHQGRGDGPWLGRLSVRFCGGCGLHTPVYVGTGVLLLLR